jgi:pimeloyl-ACP methyl ester carboxylesterase
VDLISYSSEPLFPLGIRLNPVKPCVPFGKLALDPDTSHIKPHLLLLPGMPGTDALFKPLVDKLEDHFEIDAVSYPPDEPLGYEQLLNLVTSRIPKEKPYFILGESFSGPLAVMAALKCPENILGVILVASFVTSPMPRWINRLKRFARGPILDVRPRSHINDRLMGKECDERTRIWIHENLPRLKNEVLSARVEAVLDVNVREELKSLQAPILYIAGSDDWLIGKKCINIIWLCRPDVEIKVLDGVHMILQTNPTDAAAAIKEFCGRIWSADYKVQSAEGETEFEV